LDDLELTEIEKSKIEPSILHRITILKENPNPEKIEMLVEVEPTPELESFSAEPGGGLTNEKVEQILSTQIPEDIEVIKYYGFLTSFLVKCDVGRLKKLFQIFDIVRIHDASGNIRLMSSEQGVENDEGDSDTIKPQKDEDDEHF